MDCAPSCYKTAKVNSANASYVVSARVSDSRTFKSFQKLFHQDYSGKRYQQYNKLTIQLPYLTLGTSLI
jgi:hypothetical protein